MVRARAIWFALWFGVRPWWMYEATPHYAPMSYRSHLGMNLRLAWRWARWCETVADRKFETEVNH